MGSYRLYHARKYFDRLCYQMVAVPVSSAPAAIRICSTRCIRILSKWTTLRTLHNDSSTTTIHPEQGPIVILLCLWQPSIAALAGTRAAIIDCVFSSSWCHQGPEVHLATSSLPQSESTTDCYSAPCCLYQLVQLQMGCKSNGLLWIASRSTRG